MESSQLPSVTVQKPAAWQWSVWPPPPLSCFPVLGSWVVEQSMGCKGEPQPRQGSKKICHLISPGCGDPLGHSTRESFEACQVLWSVEMSEC